MKQKNIKVVYKCRSTGGSYTQVPKIQMEGRWLEGLGFSIGSTLRVGLWEGSLHIRPMTAEELADQQRAELEKELAAKSAAIRRLQKDLHEGSRKLSHVAAPNPGYSSLSKKSR